MNDNVRMIQVNDRAAFTPLEGIDEGGGDCKGYGLVTVVEALSAALRRGVFFKRLSGFGTDCERATLGIPINDVMRERATVMHDWLDLKDFFHTKIGFRRISTPFAHGFDCDDSGGFTNGDIDSKVQTQSSRRV